jgi:RND family efflux transporter MFP subunit
LRLAVGRVHATLAALAITASAAIAAPDTTQHATTALPEGAVTVREQAVAAEYPAYAQVRPMAVVPVPALQAGTVTSMRVGPGAAVTAGEPLAILSGPEIQSALISRQGAVRTAATRLTAANRALEAERRQLAGQLSTRQSVAAAESAVAAATAALQSAQAQLDVARQSGTLRAPSAGTVIAVSVGRGQRVMAGQAVLTLQPSDSLWLEATYYGQDAAAIRVGMPGRFEPVAGSAVPVRVASVVAALAPDGGEKVGLLATGAGTGAAATQVTPWLNGEWGNVTVSGPARRIAVVPTAALIVDQAKWWVVVRTPSGDRQQAVVPGQAHGWMTYVEKGLEPGEQVVVQNAYLEFHRDIARRYTPPD